MAMGRFGTNKLTFLNIVVHRLSLKVSVVQAIREISLSMICL